MRSHKLVQQLLALSAIILGSLTLTNSSQGAEVLATPVNSETQLSSKNILNGTNYFLVKPNPVQLSPDEQVFLTKKVKFIPP
ncbi:MAG: hypothetical protein HWD59_05145 [Coxiellaceae bacterium]|nr:MAG: hypothetical protein HWD59_05145 [Coxiellaceae bacterium]